MTALCPSPQVFARVVAAADGEQATRTLESLVRQADFDAAETEARKLLRSGSLARLDVARVYLQMGIVASAKRDASAALAAFRKAIRLERDLRLASSVGPHVTETFARAKASLSESTLAAPTIVLTTAPDTAEVSVAVAARQNDDDNLPLRVSLRIGEVRETRELGAAPLHFALALPVSIATCATATASVLDAFGNELWPAVARAEVCRPLPPRSKPDSLLGKDASSPVPSRTITAPSTAIVSSSTAPRPRSTSRAVWLTGAATAAAVVGTAVLGVVALERRDEYHDSFGGSGTLEQQRHLRDLASAAQHRATAGAVMTGVLAAATMVLYIRGWF